MQTFALTSALRAYWWMTMRWQGSYSGQRRNWSFKTIIAMVRTIWLSQKVELSHKNEIQSTQSFLRNRRQYAPWQLFTWFSNSYISYNFFISSVKYHKIIDKYKEEKKNFSFQWKDVKQVPWDWEMNEIQNHSILPSTWKALLGTVRMFVFELVTSYCSSIVTYQLKI